MLVVVVLVSVVVVSVVDVEVVAVGQGGVVLSHGSTMNGKVHDMHGNVSPVQ